MRTRFIHFRPRVALVAALLAVPAWAASAAAQDSLRLRCCVEPPSGLQFWAAFDGSYAALVGAVTGGPSGPVAFTANVPPGHTGSAIALAANGRVDYPSSTSTNVGTGDFTIDAWIRLPQTPGVVPLLDNRMKLPGLTGFQLFVYNGRIGFQMADGGAAGGWTNFGSTTNVANNAWRFIVVTVDRDNPQGGRIYVDGSPVPVLTFNPTVRQGSLGLTHRLAIGHDLNNNSQGSAFEIDEIEIFRRVLTPAEVTALFRNPKCRARALPLSAGLPQ